jgi:hypothetical protein
MTDARCRIMRILGPANGLIHIAIHLYTGRVCNAKTTRHSRCARALNPHALNLVHCLQRCVQQVIGDAAALCSRQLRNHGVPALCFLR